MPTLREEAARLSQPGTTSPDARRVIRALVAVIDDAAQTFAAGRKLEEMALKSLAADRIKLAGQGLDQHIDHTVQVVDNRKHLWDEALKLVSLDAPLDSADRV